MSFEWNYPDTKFTIAILLIENQVGVKLTNLKFFGGSFHYSAIQLKNLLKYVLIKFLLL